MRRGHVQPSKSSRHRQTAVERLRRQFEALVRERTPETRESAAKISGERECEIVTDDGEAFRIRMTTDSALRLTQLLQVGEERRMRNRTQPHLRSSR